MMRSWIIAMLALVWLDACHADGQQPTVADFAGNWVVTKINNYTAVTTSEANIKALLGTSIEIGDGKVVEGGEVACKLNPKVDTISVVDTAADMPPQDGISAAAAGLPPKALKLGTSCLDFYKSGDRLIFSDRGAYYTAERSAPK